LQKGRIEEQKIVEGRVESSKGKVKGVEANKIAAINL
jgi:hypothetical protein